MKTYRDKSPIACVPGVPRRRGAPASDAMFALAEAHDRGT